MMNTGVLGLYFIILFSTFSISRGQFSQNQVIDFVTPKNCSGNEKFDAAQFRCVACPSGLTASSDHLSCRCPTTHRIREVVATGVICEPCPIGQSGVGGVCRSCPDDDCDCPVGQIWQPASGVSNGILSRNNSMCSECPQGTSPAHDQTICEPCTTFECVCDSNTTLCQAPNVNMAALNAQIRLQTGSQVPSPFMEARLPPTATRCALGNQLDCQALINLCVLQSFDRDGSTACSFVDQIRRGGAWPQQWDPLFFMGDADSELGRDSAIEQQYIMNEKHANGRLEIVLARFSIKGSLIDMVPAEQSNLLLCSHNEGIQGAFVFGRRFHRKCQTSSRLLSLRENSYFIEAFLKFVDQKGKLKMYPIPIVNRMLQSGGQPVNRMNRESNRWVLTRRFFLVDDYSIPSKNDTAGSTVRYATSIRLHVELQPTRDGLIFPPYLIIDYSERNDVTAATRLPVDFSVEYGIDPSRHDRDVEITMAVIAPSSIIWAGLCAYSWGRRGGKMFLSDASTVVQFLLFAASALADVFFVVTSIIACWLTFTYKTQTYVFYSMLNEDQEWTLLLYLMVATGLKLAALVQRHAMLITQETFFIDWEKPKITQNTAQTRPASSDVSKDRTEQPVVVWRTYLVANEWNELQNYRKTSVSLQLLAMLFVLEYLGWINYAVVESGFSRESPSSSLESTLLTRFAVVVFCYLLIGFIQWSVQVLAVERVIQDPFHNFIDLCSISNISVLSLTHSLYGYYIHGRSVHGRADTGMAEMNDFLQRERDNLCGFRGLESSSELQTFCVSMPPSFRRRYDEIMSSSGKALPQLRLTGIDQTTAKMAATVRVHQQMNSFLQELVDHSLSDVDFVVRCIEHLEYKDKSNTIC